MPGPRTKVHTGTNLWICNSDSYSYICYDLMILPGNSWKKHPRDKIGSKSHVFESKVWGACPDAATSTATVTATATCLSTLRRLEDIGWSKPGSLPPLYHWDHFYRWTTSGNMITWYDILLNTIQWYAYIYITHMQIILLSWHLLTTMNPPEFIRSLGSRSQPWLRCRRPSLENADAWKVWQV